MSLKSLYINFDFLFNAFPMAELVIMELSLTLVVEVRVGSCCSAKLLRQHYPFCLFSWDDELLRAIFAAYLRLLSIIIGVFPCQ